MTINGNVEADSGFDVPVNTDSKPRAGEDSDTDGAQNAMDKLDRALWESGGEDDEGDHADDFNLVDEEQTEVGDEEDQPESAEDDEEQVEDVAEEDIVAEEDAMPEEGQKLSPRANERIRQLVEERNAERAKVSALEAQFARFIALQEAAAEKAAAREREEAEQARQAQTIEALKAYGYNDTDVGHVLAQQAAEDTKVLKAQLDRFLAEQNQRQWQEQLRAYQNALVTELDRSITGKDGKLIVDNATREALYRATYALASTERLSPAEAVKRTVSPIVGEISKRTKSATKRPSPKDPVHKAISTQGRAVGKSPGGKTSGVKPLSAVVQAIFQK